MEIYFQPFSGNIALWGWLADTGKPHGIPIMLPPMNCGA